MSKIDEKGVEIFTSLMIDKIKEISSNWKKPWINAAGRNGLPQNLEGRVYNGINSLMLYLFSEKNNYDLPVFTTFNQARDQGISILKGSKSFPVMYWNLVVKNKDTGRSIPFEEYKNLTKSEQDKYTVMPFQRHYNVFNVAQTNLKEVNPELYTKLEDKFKVEALKDKEGQFISPALDSLINNQDWLTPIKLKEQDNAFYSPIYDTITMPVKSQFPSGESFYSTLLHEMAHSTGTEERLNREFGKKFGDEKYAKEELIAELTAAVTGQSLGISSGIREENAAYLKSWLKRLQETPKYLMSILADVNKASGMISAVIDLSMEKVKSENLTIGKEDPNTSVNNAIEVLKESVNKQIKGAILDVSIGEELNFSAIVYNANMAYVGTINAKFDNERKNWSLVTDTKDAFMIPINEVAYLDKNIYGAKLTENTLELRASEKKNLSLSKNISDIRIIDWSDDRKGIVCTINGKEQMSEVLNKEDIKSLDRTNSEHLMKLAEKYFKNVENVNITIKR